MPSLIAQIQSDNPLLRLLCLVLGVYSLILLARVILSWVALFGGRLPSEGPLRSVVELIDGLTEPVLRPLRGLIPPVRMGAVGLDLSIILLFVILVVLRAALNCRGWL